MLRFCIAGLAVAAGTIWADDKKKEEAKPEIKWSKSLKDSLAEAKKADKLVMVDVYADWCGPCKMLDAQTYSEKEVVDLCKDMISCKIDADKEDGKKVSEKYKVTGLPTILFLDGDGEIVSKFVGFRKAPEFIKSIDTTLKAKKEFPILLAKHKKDPTDCDTITKLCDHYLLKADKDTALEYIKKAEKCAKPDEPGLAKAINNVADAFQESEEFDKAIGLFKKATKFGKSPDDVSYGHGSIAACYWAMQRFAECKDACEKTLAVVGAPEEMTSTCKQMLERIKDMEVKQKKAREAKKKEESGKEKEDKKAG